MSTPHFLFKYSRPIFLTTLLLLLLLTQPALSTLANPTVDVCGPLNSNTTWSAPNTYIITCDVQVMNNITLNVQAGAVVKFNLDTSLQVDGTLTAQGATFTSTDPTPARGDWGYIFFTVTSEDAVFDGSGNYLSGSAIRESQIEWGGGATGVNGMIETNGASPFIDQNTIQYSSTRGIYATGRSATEKIVITGNNISQHTGGGVYVSSGTLTENNITNNSAGNGGGVYAVNSTLDSNQISLNSSGGGGGGIYSSGSDLTNNTISGNAGDSGGGIYAVGGTLQGNLVTGNSMSDDGGCGGGINISAGTVLDNTISGNHATDSIWSITGGGICASLSTLTNNIVTNNSLNAGDHAYGGGIYSTGSSLTLNLVTGNSSTGNDNAYGGGIYAEGGNVNNNTVENNTTAGGDFSRGGGIYGKQNTIQANTLTGNSAKEGGAIYTEQGTVTNNTVMTNTATLNGIIYVDAGTATGNTLQGNSAPYGGGIYGNNAILLGNTLENNTATIAGGGIYAVQSTVQGNTVLENDAQTDGGGIYAEEGTLTGNTVELNTVPSYGRGAGVFLTGNITFTMNSVLNNTASGGTVGGVALDAPLDGVFQFQYNNLYGNLPYDAEVVGPEDALVTLNYWGAFPCTDIPAHVYDGNDAPGRGELTFAPSLYSAALPAQLPVPTSLEMITDTTSITLDWTGISAIPNIGCRPPGFSGPEIQYFVYYDSDGCLPFDGTGLPAGTSPIDINGATTLALTNVPDETFHFAITAVDYLGRESSYSNVVVRPSSQRIIFLPVLVK